MLDVDASCDIFVRADFSASRQQVAAGVVPSGYVKRHITAIRESIANVSLASTWQ